MIKMRKFLKSMLALLLIIILGVGTYGTVKGYRFYRSAVKQTSIEEKVSSIRGKASFTSYERLPERYRQGVIAVEDRRFWEHPGVDVMAIGRALIKNVEAGAIVQGGSTITQQLAKNLYFTSEQSITRKIAEIFLALDLERHYTKEEILELYANTIYFGDGYYSIGEAAEGYFGKKPEELDTEECMMLAGIPNAPSVYAPTANPELARERMEQVRLSMEECGFLEYAASLKLCQE